MKESGKMTKLMVMVFIIMQMEPNMRVNGEMINKKALVEKNGLIIAVFKACIKMVKSMVMGSSYGLMELVMKGVGKTIKCMAKVYLLGQTGVAMKAIMKTTKNMVSVFSLGLMDADTRACGPKANKLRLQMIKEPIKTHRNLLRIDNDCYIIIIVK